MKYTFRDIHDEPVTISGDDDLEFNAPCCMFSRPVIISNCIIKILNIYATYFFSGLKIQNCHVESEVIFQSGGHNKQPILIIDTTFDKFCDFEDCLFIADVVIKNVKFSADTNLAGNKGTPVEVVFDGDLVIENVVGIIDMNTFRST